MHAAQDVSDNLNQAANKVATPLPLPASPCGVGTEYGDLARREAFNSHLEDLQYKGGAYTVLHRPLHLEKEPGMLEWVPPESVAILSSHANVSPSPLLIRKPIEIGKVSILGLKRGLDILRRL